MNSKVLKFALSISIVLFSGSLYVAVGFFFDLFIEVIPILFLPCIVLIIIYSNKKTLKTTFGNLINTIICLALVVVSIGISTGVGIIATSKPAYGQNFCCGDVQTITYSRTYMRTNYDINQKTVIKVWLPDNFNIKKSYPVMYILDGDLLFDYAALRASELSLTKQGDVIVVGVGYGYWNPTFARGGIVRTSDKNLRGRWRDFCFADDTEKGYDGKMFGGVYKKGKEYAKFLVNSVEKDIRENYNVNGHNSTLFGHSLGGRDERIYVYAI